MKRSVILAVTAALLASAPAAAQYLDEWDTDNDGLLTEEE